MVHGASGGFVLHLVNYKQERFGTAGGKMRSHWMALCCGNELNGAVWHCISMVSNFVGCMVHQVNGCCDL